MRSSPADGDHEPDDMNNIVRLQDGSVLFLDQYSIEGQLLLLLVLVVVAAVFDLRFRRIPNWLVLAGLAVSLGHHTLSKYGGGFSAWGWGLAVGLGLFLPLYMLRAMGAGDVKLMATVGSFLGAGAAFTTILLTLAAGGCLAVVYALLGRQLKKLLANVWFMLTDIVVRTTNRQAPRALAPTQSAGGLPYAVAIAVGTLLYVLKVRHTGWLSA
jgi:prepilin peptidase CpaA